MHWLPVPTACLIMAGYEWFGSSRHENTDGVHNMTFMRAHIDCDHGRYEQGIALMEELLRRKKFPVPPPNS